MSPSARRRRLQGDKPPELPRGLALEVPDGRNGDLGAIQTEALKIAGDLPGLLFAAEDPVTMGKLEQAKKIFAGLQQGVIDRSLFSANANSYFNETALKDFSSSLAPLGTPLRFTEVTHRFRGGMLLRVYRVQFPQKMLKVWTFEMPDGKLEQYQVSAVD